MTVDVPSVVRERALANPDGGHRWLERLPTVVDELASRWELTVGDTLHGGTAGYVAAAVRADGAPCVLKVAMPLDPHEHDLFRRSVIGCRLAQGRGCVELIAHDDDRSALLLEALGPNLDQLGYSVDEILRTVATTLRTFWRPVDPDCGLPTGAAAAGWHAAFVVETWRQLGQPCPTSVIDQAVRYCGERADAFDPNTAVLVHGDAHGWNTLATLDDDQADHKLVDIEGVMSHPAHDLAVPMREYNEQLAAGDTAAVVRRRAADLSRWCDVDPDAIWQWGFVDRVSTGLANLRDFNDGSGELFLEVATRCVE